jgi:zinc protease
MQVGDKAPSPGSAGENPCQTRNRPGSRRASLTTSLIDDLLLGRTFAYDAQRRSKRERLTVAEVNRAIRRHLAPNRLVIVRAGDFGKK